MEYIVSVPQKEGTKKIKVVSKYVASGDYYEITIKTPQGEKMGTLTYGYQNSGMFKKAWLNKIETKNKFAHQGVGTALIKVFEYEVYKSRCRFIEGKYYPENEFAKLFYNKYGYSIENDWNDWYVSKSLYLDEKQEKELFDMVEPIEKQKEM